MFFPSPITGINAIREDPLLTAAYYLGSGSPAIDAGLTISWLVLFHATDLDFCFARSHRPRRRLGEINAW